MSIYAQSAKAKIEASLIRPIGKATSSIIERIRRLVVFLLNKVGIDLEKTTTAKKVRWKRWGLMAAGLCAIAFLTHTYGISLLSIKATAAGLSITKRYVWSAVGVVGVVAAAALAAQYLRNPPKKKSTPTILQRKNTGDEQRVGFAHIDLNMINKMLASCLGPTDLTALKVTCKGLSHLKVDWPLNLEFQHTENVAWSVLWNPIEDKPVQLLMEDFQKMIQPLDNEVQNTARRQLYYLHRCRKDPWIVARPFQEGGRTYVTFLADGRLACGYRNGEIRITNHDGTQLIRQCMHPGETLSIIALSGDKIAVAIDCDYKIEVYVFASNGQILFASRFEAYNDFPAVSLIGLPDESIGVVCRKKGRILIFNRDGIIADGFQRSSAFQDVKVLSCGTIVIDDKTQWKYLESPFDGFCFKLTDKNDGKVREWSAIDRGEELVYGMPTHKYRFRAYTSKLERKRTVSRRMNFEYEWQSSDMTPHILCERLSLGPEGDLAFYDRVREFYEKRKWAGLSLSARIHQRLDDARWEARRRLGLAQWLSR